MSVTHLSWWGFPRAMHMSRDRSGRHSHEGFEFEQRRRRGGGDGSFESDPFDPRNRQREPHGEEFEFERGRRSRDGVRVGRGDVRAAILLLLAEQPSHGYQLIQRISERTGRSWQASPGSVYPALQLLGGEGLVRFEQRDRNRVFHLTDAGQAYVQEHRDELSTVWEEVMGSVDDRGRDLWHLLRQVNSALRQVTEVGTPPQIAAARALLINTRRQLYRILAEDELGDTES